MRGQSDNSDSGDADGTVWVTALCSRNAGATAPPASTRLAVINSKKVEAMPILLLFTRSDNIASLHDNTLEAVEQMILVLMSD
jgi:hypothetical protein